MVSLLGDDAFPVSPPGVALGNHLKLRFHDIADPMPGMVAPREDHLATIIEFAERWDQAGAMIIHCYAGVSRSTAAALVVLCRINRGREAEAVRLLRAHAPQALPNRRMIAQADLLLACDGRLAAAVEAMPFPDPYGERKLTSIPARFE
jgi:predicted protein tyrosine phosphatase